MMRTDNLAESLGDFERSEPFGGAFLERAQRRAAIAAALLLSLVFVLVG